MNRPERRSSARSDGPPFSDRQRVEAQMDKVIADSFPASDPPCWAGLCDRLNEIA